MEKLPVNDSIIPNDKNKLLDKSISYLEQAILDCKKARNRKNVNIFYPSLIEAYSLKSNATAALEAYKDFTIYKDSIINNEQKDSVRRLLLDFEFGKKQDSMKFEEAKKAIELEKEMKLNLLKYEYDKKQRAAKTAEEKQQLQYEAALKRQQIESNATLQQQLLQNEAAITKAETVKLASFKDQQITEQKLSISSQRLMNTWLIALAVLLLLVALFAYLRYRAKQKTNRQLATKTDKIETLIKELHHRVKNNMQVIGSLLSLQSSKMEDGEAKDALEQGRHRVEAMGLIHQKLYLTEDVTGVNMKDYIESLLENLLNSYAGMGAPTVKLVHNLDNLLLDIDVAIPLGLIVNELVTNAFKHGLNQDKPVLEVSLHKTNDKHIELMVADNGMGNTASSGVQNPSSFGLKLIRILTKQLNAEMVLQPGLGTKYILRFAA